MLAGMWFWKRSPGRRDQARDPAAGGAAVAHLLMVCTGNICRSPTAQGVLRAKLRLAGMDRSVWVDSAGTHGFHRAEPPDPRAIRHAARRGYDIAGLRARPVDQADFGRFHWILAMDEGNLDWLREHAPAQGQAQLGLLLEQAPDLGEREVPDPYYGPDVGFDRVLDLVELACDAVVARLARADPGAHPGRL